MNALRVLLLTGLWTVLACGGGSGPSDPGTDPDDDPGGYSYPVGKVFFSHLPIGVDSVYFWESMGALFSPFQEDHGAFRHLQMVPGRTDNSIPVIAPADGQVILLWRQDGYDGTVEHAVGLRVSTTIDLLWGHVGRLAEPLASAAPPLGQSINVEIPVQAGDTLGYVANTPLDLAVNDSAYQPAVLHPEFYGPNANAAPLEDYYREPLRSQLLGWTVREVPPRTGKYGFDVAGTLSGLWYLQGSDPTQFRFDHAIHFGYHHLQAHRSVFADGWAFAQNETGAPRIETTFWIRGNPRVEDITPASGPVTFEMFSVEQSTVGTAPNVTLRDISGFDTEKATVAVLLVQMLDAATVRIERFDGPGISAGDVPGFTENARTYVRDPIG